MLCVMEGTEPSKDEWIQFRRQCTDNHVLFVSVEVVIADGRYDKHFRVVCMVLDQVEVCYTLWPRIDQQRNRSGEMHRCNQCWGVARKSEGTIVLKEIVVVFIVLRDRVWGFGMVHRFVREMTIVYKVSEFGQMLVLLWVV